MINKLSPNRDGHPLSDGASDLPDYPVRPSLRPATVPTMGSTFSRHDRVDPPLRGDEATTLRAFLDFHRDTFRWKCSGLTRQQLAQPLAPSTMTLGGIEYARHNGHADLLREAIDGRTGE